MGAIKKSTLRRRKKAKRTARLVISSTLILVILLLGSLFYFRFRDIASLRSEINVQVAKKNTLIQENEKLAKLLSKKNDLEYIEYLARKELGLIMPGEEKYIIVGP